MTTASIVGIPAITTGTDAWIRLFEPFSTALTTLGFPKTADTGQVNWATVTLKATAVYTDYEIRRFDDAAQATSPVFMRIGYGRVTISGVQYPVISIDIGTGSNGAGVLSGVVGTTQYLLMDYSTSGKTDWKASTDGSGLALIPGGSPAIVRHFFLLERLRGANGDPLAGQLVMTKNIANATNTSAQVQTFHYDLTRAYMDTFTGVPVGYLSGISTAASTLAVLASGKYPFGVLSVPTEDGRGYSKLMVGYAQGDFLNNTEFDLVRFTDNETVHYKIVKPTVGPIHFGMMNTDSTMATATNPSNYATPALYWA